MADTRPAVDIVIRTLDRPVLLRRALADVSAQTYGDWRVIVVNDGGDPEVLEGVLAERPEMAGRATVLHNPHPHGRGVAWNEGVRAGGAEFIAVHDDDDTWHPTFLERTVGHLRNADDAAVAVRTEIVWEHVDGERIVEESREIFEPQMTAVTLFDLIRINRVVPIAMLYRRSAHDQVGEIRDDLTMVQDWEFNLRLAADGGIGFLDGEPLAYWHQRRQAAGAMANSVIDLAARHRAEDRLVREGALREHVRAHGLGALLYVTSYFQTEFNHLHGRAGVGEDLTRDVRTVLGRQAEQLEQLTELLRRQDARLAELERAVSDASLVSLVRRRYRRLKSTVTGR